MGGEGGGHRATGASHTGSAGGLCESVAGGCFFLLVTGAYHTGSAGGLWESVAQVGCFLGCFPSLLFYNYDHLNVNVKCGRIIK